MRVKYSRTKPTDPPIHAHLQLHQQVVLGRTPIHAQQTHVADIRIWHQPIGWFIFEFKWDAGALNGEQIGLIIRVPINPLRPSMALPPPIHPASQPLTRAHGIQHLPGLEADGLQHRPHHMRARCETLRVACIGRSISIDLAHQTSSASIHPQTPH